VSAIIATIKSIMHPAAQLLYDAGALSLMEQMMKVGRAASTPKHGTEALEIDKLLDAMQASADKCCITVLLLSLTCNVAPSWSFLRIVEHS
jgi:hypothetical protein